MIEVGLEPSELVVDRPNEVTLRLTNTGRGPCTNVVLKMAFPNQLVLLRGIAWIEAPSLQPGQSVTQTVIVRPKTEGTHYITSSNFSYLDPSGRVMRVAGLSLGIRATCVVELPPPPKPELDLVLATKELPLGVWRFLEGSIVSRSGPGLRGAEITVSGQVDCEASSRRLNVGPVPSGREVPFQVRVKAEEKGELAMHFGVKYVDDCGRSDRFETTRNIHGGETSQPPEKLTILFLASDPTRVDRLRLQKEIREIQEELEKAQMRDRFIFEERLAAQPRDLTSALHKLNPHVIHFSGHGTRTGGICFENESGDVHAVPVAALGTVFGLIKGRVRCVLLNACFAALQAHEIARHVDFVIGMSNTITDKAAVAFAAGFYKALGNGLSFEEAFNSGCADIVLAFKEGEVSEHLIPVLVKKTEVLTAPPVG